MHSSKRATGQQRYLTWSFKGAMEEQVEWEESKCAVYVKIQSVPETAESLLSNDHCRIHDQSVHRKKNILR